MADNQRDESTERLAGDMLVGAANIAAFLTDELDVETDEDAVYYGKRTGKLPLGKYGSLLIGSKDHLRRHFGKIARGG